MLVPTDASLWNKPSLLTDLDGLAEPTVAVSANGSRVIDHEGREFVDYLMGFGSVVLGHSRPEVVSAVMEVISRGVSPTLRSAQQGVLCERLCDWLPNAESVLLTKTGSDATTVAVRIARAATGRGRVIQLGYHGWHDWCAPRKAGVPSQTSELTFGLVEPTSDDLNNSVLDARDDLAAIVLMPSDSEVLPLEFIKLARNLASSSGAVLILDEVRTGFRVARGGLQELYGVDADLVAVSKAMANGHAISAVAGPAKYMKFVKEISCSSVFFRSTDGVAAAMATLDLLEDGTVFQGLRDLGGYLLSRLDQLFADCDLVSAGGHPSMPSVRVESTYQREFYQSMYLQGQMVPSNHHLFLSDSHTYQEVDRLTAAFDNAHAAAKSAGHVCSRSE